MRREGVEVLAVDINRDSLSLEKDGCETLSGDITDPAVRPELSTGPKAQTISSIPRAPS